MGKTTAKIIKWALLIGLGIAGLLWLTGFVADKLTTLGNELHVHLIRNQINIPSGIFPHMLFSLLFVIIEMVILVGIAGILGVFLGMLTNILLSPFTTQRIDKLFIELLPILNKNNETNQSSENKQLLDEATKLRNRWDKHWINKISRWTTGKKNREKFDKTKL